MKTRLTLPLVWLSLLPALFCLRAPAQGTAFTYQGRLNDGAAPAGGLYEPLGA